MSQNQKSQIQNRKALSRCTLSSGKLIVDDRTISKYSMVRLLCQFELNLTSIINVLFLLLVFLLADSIISCYNDSYISDVLANSRE